MWLVRYRWQVRYMNMASLLIASVASAAAVIPVLLKVWGSPHQLLDLRRDA
jgi:hypothetical protein